MAVTAAASLVVLVLAATTAAAQHRCPPDTLAVYRAVLSTHWTRDLFPKQYPEIRPPAQWSRLLGRSHDATFELFSEGRLASTALKYFAEVGKTDAFDVHRQGFDGVMDTFGADAITQGEGQAKAKFYMDSNHSLVSLVVRMVPSPDWFIGVNSINLCSRDGEWEDKKYLQLTLMDAGTDTGFTFTSPNWPSDPPQPISVITAQYPDHPASSFYYPDLKHLPVIATLQFTKVKVFKLSQEFVELDAAAHLPKLALALEETEAQELLNNRVSVHAPSVARVATADDGVQTSNQTAARRRLARNKLRSLRVRRIKNRRRHNNQQTGENQPPLQREHCVMSEWTEWSACGNSCGTGASTRRRTILKKGRQCQGLLEQSTWCSSYTDCPEKFFKW